MSVLVFLLGVAFGIGLTGLLSGLRDMIFDGLTEQILMDTMHDGVILIFIFALLRVYLQL